jgi:hypothetical protein
MPAALHQTTVFFFFEVHIKTINVNTSNPLINARICMTLSYLSFGKHSHQYNTHQNKIYCYQSNPLTQAAFN